MVPRLESGITVVSDRYLASTLVVQALDGGTAAVLFNLNAGIRLPDLAVILNPDPHNIAARVAARGATHRFNRAPDFPARESALYAEVVVILRDMGVPVLVADTSTAPAGVIVERIASYAPARLGSVAPDRESAPTQGAPPS